MEIDKPVLSALDAAIEEKATILESIIATKLLCPIVQDAFVGDEMALEQLAALIDAVRTIATDEEAYLEKVEESIDCAELTQFLLNPKAVAFKECWKKIIDEEHNASSLKGRYTTALHSNERLKASKEDAILKLGKHERFMKTTERLREPMVSENKEVALKALLQSLLHYHPITEGAREFSIEEWHDLVNEKLVAVVNEAKAWKASDTRPAPSLVNLTNSIVKNAKTNTVCGEGMHGQMVETEELLA